MIIQIIGLPGSGKTTLAEELAYRINAIHLNADYVRSTVNSDLGFELPDRIEHARRLGEMARMLSGQGHTVVVDFICPTQETRDAFGTPDVLIWMNTIKEGRFEDTNRMFVAPKQYDTIFNDHDLNAKEKAQLIIKRFRLHDWSEPTTLMLGRYQPWHEGHHALYHEAGKRTDQVMLGVRNTQGTSAKDPLSFEQVKFYIDKDPAMKDAMVVRMPNITNIVYGRDVGWTVSKIDLPPEIEAISATKIREGVL